MKKSKYNKEDKGLMKQASIDMNQMKTLISRESKDKQKLTHL